ncbi:PREDICTED: cytochrome P450 6j1-like [Nicrophorus vespilloides]|uniref:Cytochrome P450 6j1-like n=1 Tax=Nicrophorus vespilloides TaxID=110193 RepID=A0ABM1NI87_NICVS|nr:PREDICTED: cytochrome P450 6j1-like [Nicrophorus vespilloides]
MWIFLSSAAGLLCILYVLLKWRYNYWRERGVPCPQPSLFVGNIGASLTSKLNIGEIYNNIYKKYEDCKYVGLFQFINPALLIRDPEIIKDIMIKDFNHFGKNDFEVDADHDPILGRNPFVLSGEKWKAFRNMWTPNFTSGKLKQIFQFVKIQSVKMNDYIENHQKCVDLKDLMKRFTIGNVASCAFGLEANSFEEEESEFVKISRQIGDISGFSTIKVMLRNIFPFLVNVLSVRFFSKYVEEYLIRIVKETLNYRKENKVVRNDFLDTMAEQKVKCTYYKFEDIDIVSQSAGFFADGVESSSVVMSYALYEIARNPEVQSKLKQEIRDHGEISYESVNEMKYMDCVLNESMRMHWVSFFLTKKCTEDYRLPPTKDGAPSIMIQKDTSIILPMDALHKDAKYFPNPEIFDPERFTNENKANITKCSFMPFGEGPRICLGMKFGLMQIKVGIAAILSKYTISINEKTSNPLQFEKNAIIRTPIGGIWMDFQKD